MMRVNDLGQPVGDPVNMTSAALPDGRVLQGRLCRLEPMDPDRHTSDLFAAFAEDSEGRMWTYLPTGPYEAEADLHEWLTGALDVDALYFYAIVDMASGQAVGLASYLRVNPIAGSIEVGWLTFAPRLQGTTAATEAMFLMMRYAFSMGYRRYEWKCDALNAASGRAAERLGFSFEGIFRQATRYKERNRDTAWYSVLDGEWPALERAFEGWLSEKNFDSAGRQGKRLADFIALERG